MCFQNARERCACETEGRERKEYNVVLLILKTVRRPWFVQSLSMLS